VCVPRQVSERWFLCDVHGPSRTLEKSINGRYEIFRDYCKKNHFAAAFTEFNEAMQLRGFAYRFTNTRDGVPKLRNINGGEADLYRHDYVRMRLQDLADPGLRDGTVEYESFLMQALFKLCKGTGNDTLCVEQLPDFAQQMLDWALAWEAEKTLKVKPNALDVFEFHAVRYVLAQGESFGSLGWYQVQMFRKLIYQMRT
jgi:hypothetical protein